MARPTLDELKDRTKKPPRTRRRRIISVPRHICHARCYECDRVWGGDSFEEVRRANAEIDDHYNHTGHYIEITEERTRSLGVPPPQWRPSDAGR